MARFLHPIGIALVLVAFLAGCGSASAPAVTRSHSNAPKTVAHTYTPPASHPLLASNFPAPTIPALASLAMENGQVGWGTTTGAVYRTLDGGATWHDVTPSGSSPGGLVTGDFLSAEQAWVAISPSNPKLPVYAYFTSDGGKTWVPHSVPHLGSVDYLDFLNSQTGWLATGISTAAGDESITLFNTVDGGKVWTRSSASPALNLSPNAAPASAMASSAIPLEGVKSGLKFISSDDGWMTGGAINLGQVWLYRTEDGGTSWKPEVVTPPANYANHLIWTDPPEFFNPSAGVMALHVNGTDGPATFYITRDGGNTWSPTAPVLPDALWTKLGITQWSWTDPTHGWALAEPLAGASGAMPALYHTTDAGRTWTEVISANWLAEVTEFDFVSDSQGFAVVNGSPVRIWSTNDQGAHWAPVNAGPMDASSPK